MKKTLALTTLMLAVAACAPKAPEQAAAPADAAAPAASTATADSADTVVRRHVTTIKAGDLEGVMADYADDTVVVTPAGAFTPNGVFSGKAKARELFATLTGKDNLPAVSTMQATYEAVGPDVVVMKWEQYPGTPQSATGQDVFVVRNGKIVFQNVAPDPAKK